MIDVTFRIAPFFSTPWQIKIYLFHKDEAGYRFLRARLLSIEESLPAIRKDSDGLAVIDNERLMEIVDKLGFDKNIQDAEYQFQGPVYTEQDLESLSMKRSLLREWKEFEDWYSSRTILSNKK